MSVSLNDMTMAELASYVCEKLLSDNIKVVLSGGGCVQVYSNDRYTSDDLDLINIYSASKTDIKKSMLELGFTINKSGYYTHTDTHFFIEFPKGPLGVGDKEYIPIEETNQLTTKYGTFRILTPQDCIKDRLTAYFFYNDIQTLRQASWVAIEQNINTDEIFEWATTGVNKGQDVKFNNFVMLVQGKEVDNL
jgi:hypothetical protein